MATGESIIDKQFSEAYNTIFELYQNDQLEECESEAKQLLEDPAIPRYHRIKTYLLLGSCVEEWTEAESYRSRAETLWRIVRRWHQEGEDAKIDAALQELRTSLDFLQQDLENDRPEEYDFEATVEGQLADHDRLQAEEMELAEAEQDDPEELAKADAATMEAQMRDMELEKETSAKVCVCDCQSVSTILTMRSQLLSSLRQLLPPSTRPPHPTSPLPTAGVDQLRPARSGCHHTAVLLFKTCAAKSEHR